MRWCFGSTSGSRASRYWRVRDRQVATTTEAGMSRALLFVLLFCITNSIHALDATDRMTAISQSGRWQAVKSAASKQTIYRLESTSTNNPDITIFFKFIPSNDCVPKPAVMIMQFSSHHENLGGGLIIFEYKLPSREKTAELVKTTMSDGAKSAFFSFEKLAAQPLLGADDKGRIAIWVPASGDGTVKRSEDIYFSLQGFSAAYKETKRLCGKNITNSAQPNVRSGQAQEPRKTSR